MLTKSGDMPVGTEEGEETKAPTAGEVLLQERQRLDLNEKEVADQLHITMHYVKALESNSYEKLPGAVFTKGYIKSYALLLGLDAEDILARYGEFNTQRQANIEEVSRKLWARKKKDRNKPLVIVSVLVFVGGFLGLWLANSYFGDDPVFEAPTSAESGDSADSIRLPLVQQPDQQLTTQPQLTLQVDTDEGTVTQPITNALVVEETIDQQFDLSPAESTGLVDAVPGVAEFETLGDEQSSPSLQDITAALQALRAEQAAIDATGLALAPEGTDQPQVISVEAIGSDVLRISFTGESWIEVNDSESQQIYRDIRAAGDVLEITGSAPFNILLGDAPLTRMSLNGDEIDLSEDIRIDNSARLTVGL